MNNRSSQGQTCRVAIIGGGITGLAAAQRLHARQADADVTLFESSHRLGGVIETVRQDGFCFERSADNFITNVPWALDLCHEIGFADQLIQTNQAYRQALVVCRGKLEKIPEGFLIMAPSRIWPIITTPILSWPGKLRLACEYFVPRKTDQADESLASFARRRLGRNTYQRLVQPLVGGIYTADPEKLSVRATMPRFLEMEQRHGSLTKAAWRRSADAKKRETSSSGARYSMFVTARDGLTSFIQALAARLPERTIRLNTAVTRIKKTTNGRWSIEGDNDQSSVQEFDALVLATPAHRAASLLADVDRPTSTKLSNIPYAPCAVVSLGYRREQIGHPMDGFGFVVPAVENRRILSGSFSSVKYVGRAPVGCELIRVFLGGACQAELTELPDDELIRIATDELRQLLSIRGVPMIQHISRWRGAMAQYHLGHCELIEQIESEVAKLSRLELAGNAYHGVGIPNCILSGQQAAERIVAALECQKRNAATGASH